ncbi:hypothetical protein BTK96_001110 [Burkholderia pyrrocinia]|uniref:hypothetical protein n=1 Tax=Burkholderia sp. IT-111MI5 TaxID=3026439 RepID=UPI002A3176B4|nr:hypothetical protein [Burkholderia pyrrocinia]EKS9892860.1 hypothetical protein [Burkholderia pyrrocinia]EKS9909376.1 hypothetical protein [Burkholderia pyrrocinia]
MRQIKLMRKGAENGLLPDESGQLIGEETGGKADETQREKRKSSGKSSGKKQTKKTAAGQAAVFDAAL